MNDRYDQDYEPRDSPTAGVRFKTSARLPRLYRDGDAGSLDDGIEKLDEFHQSSADDLPSTAIRRNVTRLRHCRRTTLHNCPFGRKF